MRAIDADAFHRKVIEIRDSAPDEMKKIKYTCNEILLALLDEAEAADAVEVVRCKDCDKSVPSDMLGCGWRFCRNNSQHHKDDHFCGYGERRNDG